MKSAGSRRLAKWRSPYRGLLAPDRSGDGALILDRNPRSRRLSTKRGADSKDRDGFAVWAALTWGLAFEMVLSQRI